jgi:AraC-like DNA-binding protein
MLRAARRLGARRHVKLCQGLALALRALHADPARPGTVVEQLAKKAALSRSSFFERFTRAVGQPPMEVLLAWRMARAKELLRGREGKLSVGRVAERVGTGSGSTFSTAFRRCEGVAPRGITWRSAGRARHP